VKLERIEIQSLPGIARGFAVEGFAEGVTLVTGPNASGKSSLLRALRYLLAGVQDDDPPALALSADFIDEQSQRWQVRRAGRELSWRCDGRESEPPPLPEPEALQGYLMRIEDLVVAHSDHDRGLSERLRRELHGGYDLEVLRRPPFQFGDRKGSTERNALAAARQKRRIIERDYEALVRQEQELPRLDAEIEQSRRAPERLRRVEQALERIALADRADALTAQLTRFPDAMHCLLGDEPKRLADLEQRIAGHRRRHTEDCQALQDLEVELEATGLADERPADSRLEQVDDELRQLQRLVEQRDRVKSEREAALLRRQQAVGSLGGSETAAAIPRLDPDSVAEAETLARELQLARQRRDQLAAEIDGVEVAPDPATMRMLDRGIDALQAWLAEPDRRRAPASVAALLSGLGGASVLAVWSLPIHAPDWPPLPDWLLPVGGLMALLASCWLLLVRSAGPRRQHRAAYLELALPQPEQWSRMQVTTLQRQLQDRRADLEDRRRRAEHAEMQRDQLAGRQAALEAMEARCRELGGRLGFDPQLTAAGFDRFVRLADSHQQAELAAADLARGIERLGGEIERLRREIARALRPWTGELLSTLPQDRSTSDPEQTLARALTDLRQRSAAAQRAADRIDELRERVRRTAAELDLLDAERQRLLADAGIEEQEVAELARRIERLDEWRELQRASERLRIEAEALDRALAGDVEFEHAVAERDRAGLNAARDEARTQAAAHQLLMDRRAELRARLDSAGTDGRLAQALADEAEARDRLEALQREAVAAECAGLLLNEIERDFRQHHEPALLRAARERFAAFTHHAWDLALQADRGFHAIETASGTEHALGELSTATRMQLLLALRTSWAEHQERGRMPLPFVLDEALTTSDPERFGSVATSLQQLAAERGRQVIYLSAGAHEPWLWEQATGTAPRRIDLAEVRRGVERAELPSGPVITRPEPPSPDGLEAREYARRIEVPRLEPWLQAEEQHPFWVLDDRLELLHQLLKDWRVQRIGALSHLLEGPKAAIAVPDAGERQRLLARIELLRTWIDAWRIGRGRPLDRGTLEQAEGITEKMLEQVCMVAADCDGDAARLVQALNQGAVTGFRKAKLEEFEQWLEQHGHLDRRVALDSAARRAHLLERFPATLDVGTAQAAIDLLERSMQ
jgi:DNA repair exonuclease SbcCD ATPase subunit